MANLPDFSDLNLTKGGFYTLINELQTYLNDSIGSTGTPEGVKINLSLDSVNNTSDLAKPISTATQTALNTKQATLVAGTNIKTINSTSLLGSGNINLQATLESGTNIKTINSASILGSGNINLMDLTSSQTISGIKTFSSSPIVPTPTTDFQVATKEYADTKMTKPTATAGSKVCFAAGDLPISKTANPYGEIRGTYVPYGGTYTVYFNMTYNSISSTTAYARIYVNGSAVGTVRSLSADASGAWSENVTVNEGDRISIYVQTPLSSTYYMMTINSFRLSANEVLEFA